MLNVLRCHLTYQGQVGQGAKGYLYALYTRNSETGLDQWMAKQDKMSMYTDNGKTLFLCPREAGRDRWQNSYDKMSIYMNIMEWGVGGGEVS